MENLKYILKQKSIYYIMIFLLLFCCFYSVIVDFEETIDYIWILNVRFVYSLFPLLYYYLLNLEYKYHAHQFISIRYHHKEKQKIIMQTLLLLFYTIFIFLLFILPNLVTLGINGILYTLEMSLLNFSVLMLFTNLVSIVSKYVKFNISLGIFIVLETAWYFIFIEGRIIELSPGITRTAVIITIAICLVLSLVGIVYRMGDRNV